MTDQTPKRPRRITRPLTAAEQDRLTKARRETEEDKPQILASARRAKAEHDAVTKSRESSSDPQP